MIDANINSNLEHWLVYCCTGNPCDLPIYLIWPIKTTVIMAVFIIQCVLFWMRPLSEEIIVQYNQGYFRKGNSTSVYKYQRAQFKNMAFLAFSNHRSQTKVNTAMHHMEVQKAACFPAKYGESFWLKVCVIVDIWNFDQ